MLLRFGPLAMFFVLALAVGGCGGGDSDRQPGAGSSESASATTSEVATSSLVDLCPQIEADFPVTDFGFPDGPRETAQFADFAESLHEWVDESDIEARPVVEKMAAAVDFAVQRDQGVAEQNVQASQDLDASVVAAKKACASAGVPIFH